MNLAESHELLVKWSRKHDGLRSSMRWRTLALLEEIQHIRVYRTQGPELGSFFQPVLTPFF